MNISLGKKIRALRLQSGRTQEEVAAALDVTPQAVSRWEKNICYPDMELLPVIANYFGVTIDALFGYEDERDRKIRDLAARITEMNRQNNGEDINLDECIALAREGLAEFPGSEPLTLCLASVLYNAGYVRYGEHHLTDPDGYDRYDVARHRTYAEWREAILLYERLLNALPEGSMRGQAVTELAQLYANTGEWEKASALTENRQDRHSSREFLRLNACDGKERAKRYGETVLLCAADCADLMVSTVLTGKYVLTPAESTEVVRSAVHLIYAVCPDGEFGMLHGEIARLELYLSFQLWRAGARDEAFSALEEALAHASALKAYEGDAERTYTAPGLRLVKINPEGIKDLCFAAELPEIWPCWMTPDSSAVAGEMRADPRWEDWCVRCRKAAKSPE